MCGLFCLTTPCGSCLFVFRPLHVVTGLGVHCTFPPPLTAEQPLLETIFVAFVPLPVVISLGVYCTFPSRLSSPGLEPPCPCNRAIVVLFFRDPLLVLDNKRGCTIGCLVLFVGTGLAVNFPNRTIVGFVYCFTEALHLF